MKHVELWTVSVAVGVLFAALGSAGAASHTIQMTSSLTFSPSSLTVAKGDTVIWTNVSIYTHDSISGPCFAPTGLWTGPDELPNGSFTLSTSSLSPGTYSFYCSHHCQIYGMVGSLTVTGAANSPPSVTITNPIAGAVLAAPANVTIEASASDTDGSVTNVQFLVGATILANVTTAPYAATTNGLPAGNYTLAAIASDNGGAKATNSVNIIIDAPPSVSLTNPVAGATFRAPASIPLMAAASDTDGSVTNVQFFSGASLLGSAASAPFNFTVNNLVAGNYSFTARAADNHGIARTSAVVNVFVFTNTILSAPARLTNGEFQFTVIGIAGQTYAIEASTNLVNFSAISTNVAPSNTFNVIDPSATNIRYRFYRVRQNL